jgi:hypothetical protein
LGRGLKNGTGGGGVQPFFEMGLKIPSFHFETLYLHKNAWAKPYFYVVRKKLLDYLKNWLRARLENIPYYLS